MNLGKVIGTVVSTVKSEGLEGIRLLVVQPINKDFVPKKTVPIVAVDSVQAGTGDVIFYVNSREAALGLENTFVPVDACIVGHVDMVGAKKVES